MVSELDTPFFGGRGSEGSFLLQETGPPTTPMMSLTRATIVRARNQGFEAKEAAEVAISGLSSGT